MRIGVDLDGVCFSFTDCLRQWLIRKGWPGEQVAPPATCWDFYLTDWHIPLDVFLTECNMAADAGFLFAHGDPLPGTTAALRQLADAGHELHIVTDRSFGTTPHASRMNTLYWLHAWSVPFNSLTFSADKTSVWTDMFIDDKPANVDALVAAGCDAWLLDDGRQDQVGHGRLIPNWQAFVDLVDSTTRSLAC